MRRKILALIMMITMIAEKNVYAAESRGIIDTEDGVTYTVGASCGTYRGMGYGRCVDASKGLSLTVEFSYRDYDGNWHTLKSSKGGTTYVEVKTDRGTSIDQATKRVVSRLYIEGDVYCAELE